MNPPQNLNFMIVKQSIANADDNKKLRNRARQMRAEAPILFVPLRDTMFPPIYGGFYQYEPFEQLYFTSSEVRKQHGKLIFERVCNYLRLLAAKGFYPRGYLEEQIIILQNITTRPGHRRKHITCTEIFIQAAVKY
ncbi:Conserved_hypothetical protein [Hexamita inflata]|uniref:Uncharacterized protein n=1 Tax=Hexamita inflata TaxID=28002 RepID=A0AA86V0C5_9EUKA|nr:Conserved hypothetical protein [Hexamita inflata]